MKGIFPLLIAVVAIAVVGFMFANKAELIGPSFCANPGVATYQREIRVSQSGPCFYSSTCEGPFQSVKAVGVPDNVIENLKKNNLKLAEGSEWHIYCTGSNCGGLDQRGQGFAVNADTTEKSVNILAGGSFTTPSGGRPGDGTTCYVDYVIKFDDSAPVAITPPAETTVPSVPPAYVSPTVCGDAKCELPETATSCKVDCGDIRTSPGDVTGIEPKQMQPKMTTLEKITGFFQSLIDKFHALFSKG